MKKNKMMRVASALLIAVLLTTSAISGTFAKYVTAANAGDTARVAKWGIVMDSTGNAMFATTYASNTNNYSQNSVESSNVDKLVAPGTTNSETYSITGAPETAYKITFAGTATKDIFLKSGSKFAYTDAQNVVTYTAPGSGTVTADYYPVNYSITIATTKGTVAGTNWTAGNTRTFETLSDAMTALSAASVTFDPNESCDVVVTIAWEWVFDSSATPTIAVTGHTSSDIYDTVLGDLMAQNADLSYKKSTDADAVADEDYCLSIVYDLVMTATQID